MHGQATITARVTAQRGDLAFVGAYLPQRDKAALLAAAQRTGRTLSEMLRAMAADADRIAAQLDPRQD